jgi:hypothetical protein
LNTEVCIPAPYVIGDWTGVYFRKLAFEMFDFLETGLNCKKKFTIFAR